MKYPKYPVFASDLGFGDWNEVLQDVDDSNRTNNGDRDQVLATVAATALTFTKHFPNAQIFIQGSTPARTRLYQMGIGHNLLEINENFNVRGFTDDGWEAFQFGRNYTALLINKK